MRQQAQRNSETSKQISLADDVLVRTKPGGRVANNHNIVIPLTMVNIK
jgi:hypothetical protein